MDALVRWLAISACVVGLAASGCFNPKVKSGGFACSASDPVPCPQGFFCVDGLCQSSPGGGGNGGVGGNGGDDQGTSAVADMAGGAFTRDFSTGHPGDMSAPADFAQSTPQDFAQAPQCSQAGTACSSSSECCNGVCFIVCL